MELRLDWKTTYNIQESPALTAILNTHRAVFTNESGTITCAKAEIHVDPQIPPSFHRPRLVQLHSSRRSKISLSCLSTILAPLNNLFRKGVAWRWKLAQGNAFKEAKDRLKSPQLLVHYDHNKELVLTCDASLYTIGAVLAHCMEDRSELPIEYAS